jgi:23S rRNA pseudouridine955/2504/2580 synthase
MKTFKIENLEMPIRLDKWLKSNCNLNYALIQKLIRKSDIKVNGKKNSRDQKLINGDIITIYAKFVEQVPPTTGKIDKKECSKLLEQIKKSIIFKDDNIIAINKPYGIASQSGTGIKISIDDILDGLMFDCKIRPRLVHRLDRYTTGLLLLARNQRAAGTLTQYFKDGLIEKKYLAVLAGNLKNKTGIIKSEIAKFGSKDLKEAVTKYKVLISNPELQISFVEFTPITGRTHQIRIHAAQELGCSIVSDIKYGDTTSLVPELERKIHLHSSEIKIKNFFEKDYSLKVDPPSHIEMAIKKIT